MKRFIVFLEMLILVFVLTQCTGGKDEEEPGTRDTPDGNLNNMQESIEKMKDFMTGDVKVEPVDFRDLKELLPEKIGELERKNASGEKSAAFGMNISRTEADYMSPDSEVRISLEITDLGSLKGLTVMTGFAWAFGEFDKETDTGYERTTTYDGFKAMEEYDFPTKSGKINVLVAERFSVNLEGRNISMEELKSILKNIDLEKLSSWKESGIEK